MVYRACIKRKDFMETNRNRDTERLTAKREVREREKGARV